MQSLAAQYVPNIREVTPKNLSFLTTPHTGHGRTKVRADLCELDGRTYLVLVDYYSNFIEVDHLKETSLQMLQITIHGIPDILTIAPKPTIQ